MKIKNPIKYVECYYDGDKLKETHTLGGIVFLFFFFWIVPIVALILLFYFMFKESFWVTEKEYYETKLSEVHKK